MDWYELRLQDYSLNGDQESVRDAFSDFFRTQSTSAVVRAAEPLGYDASLWRKLAGMGVASMGLPSDRGGDDASLIDLALIAEEVGRTLAPVPFFGHVVTTRLIGGAPGGEAVLDEAASADEPFALAFRQQRSGEAQLVPDGAIARNVVAYDGDQLVLWRAEKAAPHVANQGFTPLAWWEPAPDAELVVLAQGEKARALYRTAVTEWKLLMAAGLVGLTEGALQLALDFVRSRETMGVPVGALQGVSFPLADVAINVATGRNLTWRAAWMLENEPQSDPALPALAYAFAARAATHGATTSAHMQGGLGFTIEADASLYFLRAKGWSVLGGDPTADLVEAGTTLLASLTA
jgi:alkylation response protein AidB-like acyl-CoA dehydrogenase